jgi:uncharacterized RDD family membrane protein YckC
MRLALSRVVAWFIDWACIMGWVAVTAAVGVPLYLAGRIPPLSPLALNLIGAVIVVVPVVVAATLFESSRRGATPGKRVTGLSVDAGGRAPTRGRALLRNSLKIGLPWLIGHAAVFALTGGGAASPEAGAWALIAVAYVIPIVWVASLFLSSGRTPYDRIAGTTVRRVG